MNGEERFARRRRWWASSQQRFLEALR